MRCRGKHTFFGSCGASEKSKRQSAALPFAFEIKENIKDGGIQESNLEKNRRKQDKSMQKTMRKNIERTALAEKDHEYLLDRRRLSAIIAINSLLVGFPLLF